jgi:phenylacetate-CoA ligase
MEYQDSEHKLQIQLERLQATLNRAFRSVPFHQNRFKKHGKEPFHVETIEDLSRLPFMERKDLGEHYPYGLFAVPLRDIVRIHTAPGISLNPTVSGYTKQDLKIWREMVARALAASGVTALDILQITFESGLANWGRDYKDGAETLEASVIPNTPLSLEKQLMVLRDYKTTVLITTPSSASQLASYMFLSEFNPTGINLKTLILVGDMIEPEFRAFLENKLHVSVWIQYGLSEVPGPAMAFECLNHKGLHVNEDHFIPEIIDPKTGEILPPGETGELVFTSLSTRAFPLIRFRTGDRARLIPEDCSCGCPFIRIEWLGERTDDLITINGVKLHQPQIIRHLEKVLGFAPDQCRIFKKEHSYLENYGARNYLEVWLLMNEKLFSDEIKMLQQLIHNAEEKLHENIGVPVKIKLREMRTLFENFHL